jgi:hypothetical protein
MNTYRVDFKDGRSAHVLAERYTGFSHQGLVSFIANNKTITSFLESHIVSIAVVADATNLAVANLVTGNERARARP